MGVHWRLEYSPRPDWPQLAWLARCPPDAGAVEVSIGSGVEASDGWFSEAVWAGEFAAGDLDRTDLVFGSGGRLRDAGVTFVSSSATVDRLHTAEVGGALLVSNSLPCLLAALGGRLRDDVDHRERLGTIRRGINGYEPVIPIVDGEIRIVHHHNLRWDGTAARTEAKPTPARDFSSFASYRQFLGDTMSEIAANLASASRKRPLSMLATLSSGYDSPAVAAIAHECGCTEAFGFEQGRDGRDDSGEAVAAALGMHFEGLQNVAYLTMPVVETRFLAPGIAGGSSIPLLAAEGLLDGRVLLTGYQGDKMWDLDDEGLGGDHPRTELGGSDLQEFRLSAGFIQLPLAFAGGRQMIDVHELSTAPEMTPWRVRGNYDRPIPRRIVEESGVRRGAFAVEKRAMQQFFVLTNASQEAFDEWQATQRPGDDPADNKRRADNLFLWAVESETARYGTDRLRP